MTQDLLRARTDEQVLRALMEHRRLTRAELATATGISKPTAGESVRRLTDSGLVTDTGERTPGGRGRGRVGSYYALSDAAGVALAVGIAPEGVAAECIDSYGDVVGRVVRELADDLTGTIRAVAAEVTAGTPTRLAVVSVADPVDRHTGRAVHLPDAPFLVGELAPKDLLAPYVAGPFVVDNDVNWAAQAERTVAGDDFAYVHLGEGLGCAVVSDGRVLRGHAGIAGEIAHLITAGPDGRAMPFTEVFAELGLRLPGSTAIDVRRIDASRPDVRKTVARAVCGVLTAAVALVDPAVIVLGGTWGPVLRDEIAAEFARQPRHVPVRAATVTDEPALTGARARAVELLRAAVVDLGLRP